METVAPAADALRDALARVIAIREALECGDNPLAHTIARDLEDDLAGTMQRIGALEEDAT